jgi:hypothetical protein
MNAKAAEYFYILRLNREIRKYFEDRKREDSELQISQECECKIKSECKCDCGS